MYRRQKEYKGASRALQQPLLSVRDNDDGPPHVTVEMADAEFKQHFNAGMIGVNVGVPAPMAWFPFTGWNQSFFGDLHIQGTESVHFYTRQKMTLTRWFASSDDSHHDPVWKTK